MTAETRKHLIYGGGLILAVVVGVVFYKKYQVNSQASSAANDQAMQDQLDYIESLSLQSPYSSYGSSTSAAAAPTPPALPSITDEITQLDQLFGVTPTSASGSSGSASGSSGTRAGEQAARTTHNLGSGAPAGQPRAADVLAGGFDTYHGGPVLANRFRWSSYDEPPVMQHEGLAVA